MSEKNHDMEVLIMQERMDGELKTADSSWRKASREADHWAQPVGISSCFAVDDDDDEDDDDEEEEDDDEGDV